MIALIDVKGILDAFNGILNTLLNNYGPAGTLAILIGLVVLSFGWRLFTDWRRERKIDRALAEKEETIQRQAKEIRMYRALFFKEKAGWDDNLINKFIGNEKIEGESKQLKPARRRLLPRRRGK